MSDKDINQMDFKELRKEVQSLRDELAIMQRKYEDILYNLDDENFSSQFIKERDGMKAELKITAEEISTKVSSEDVESMISQTAEQISSRIEDVEDAYSYIEQEVDNISSKVSDEDGVYSLFEQTSGGFLLDGKRVKVSGVLQLVDDDGEPLFSIFFSRNNVPGVYMWGYGGPRKLILGDEDGEVYVSYPSAGNEVATHSYVEDYLVGLI